MSEHLPPFDDIDLALEDLGAAQGAAGVHGLLSGLACAGGRLSPARLRSLLADELDADPGEDLFRELAAIDRVLRRQLLDEELGFELLLPDEDVPLAMRVKAMAEWCDGFLAGFGTGSGNRRDADLSEDVRSLLASIGDISRAELGDDESDEEAERDYMELVEYLRIAALTVYTEIAMPGDEAKALPPGPPLH